MLVEDYDTFVNILGAIADMKGKPLSEWTIGVWWKALQEYDLAAVDDALVRHVRNPDNGQFMPAPADVIKLIGGNTVDAALMAWAKVDKGVRSAGPWADVAFDDPLIHRVIEDMGGWAGFGQKTDKEWPFVAKEFENRYRGYRTRADLADYLPLLTGTWNTHNIEGGHVRQTPILIGNASKATAVMRGGSGQPLIEMRQAGALLMESLSERLPAAPLKLASRPASKAAKIIDLNFTKQGKRA